jgi:plasmid maintenance system antidote protein VapI
MTQKRQSIVQQLAAALREHADNSETVSEKTGVHRNTIQRLRSGKHSTTAPIADAVAEVLGMEWKLVPIGGGK